MSVSASEFKFAVSIYRRMSEIQKKDFSDLVLRRPKVERSAYRIWYEEIIDDCDGIFARESRRAEYIETIDSINHVYNHNLCFKED